MMDYQTFWRTYFPEQALISRERALEKTGKKQQFATVEELRDYQRAVAPVYGAYELEAFQLVTMEKLLPALDQFSQKGHLISLGSGPGSYELWLLAMGFIRECTLVDISESMLERAREIAKSLDLADRIQTICEDISTVSLPEESADACVSINSLHWSPTWREWIKKAIKYTKPGGFLFLSGSLFFPQSQITQEQFLGVAARGIAIREHGFLQPGAVVGNQYVELTQKKVLLKLGN
jgi:ubiquinone/menaquinone biosynthesis C-methylase UbiE